MNTGVLDVVVVVVVDSVEAAMSFFLSSSCLDSACLELNEVRLIVGILDAGLLASLVVEVDELAAEPNINMVELELTNGGKLILDDSLLFSVGLFVIVIGVVVVVILVSSFDFFSFMA